MSLIHIFILLCIVVPLLHSQCISPQFGPPPACPHYLSLKFSQDFKELNGILNIQQSANFTKYLESHGLQHVTPSASTPLEIPCYAIFKRFSSAKGILGWDPKCHFIAAFASQDNFRVTLGREANVAPGGIVSVLRYPFSEDDAAYADTVLISSDISDSLKPIAVITAPSDIGSCTELFVDGSASHYPGADLALSYNWTITQADGVSPVSVGSQTIDVSAVHSAFLKIPQFVDAPAATYKIFLVVSIFSRNNIGGSQQRNSLQVEHTIVKHNYALPVPRIAGGVQQNVALRAPHTVFGSADLSTCYQGRPVEYKWFEQLADGSRAEVDNSNANVVPRSGALLFPQGINSNLSNRTFVLQLNSSMPAPSYTTLLTETSVTLVPYLRDLSVNIVDSSRVVNVLKSLADAAGESNPLYILNSTHIDMDDESATKTFSWTVPAEFTALVIGGTTSPSLALDLNALNSQAPLNGTFKLTVTSTTTHTSQVRTATDSAHLLFTTGNPTIRFVSPPSTVNADSRLILRIAAQAPEGAIIERYSWSVDGLLSETEWKKQILAGTSTTSRVLAFKRNTFTPGTTYTVTATVHTTSGSSSVSTTFRVNTPPSGGVLSTNHVNATVLQSIVFSCDNYVDPDTPLEYAYYYKIGSVSDFVPITPFIASNFIEFPFPLEGTGAEYKVTIQARIRDRHLSQTIVEKVIYVRPLASEHELELRVNAVKALLLKASEQRNIFQLQLLIASLSKFIAETKTNFLDQTARRELRTLLTAQILFLNQLRSADTVSSISTSDVLFQSEMLQSLTQDLTEVSSSAQLTASQVINQLIKNNPSSIDETNAKSLSQTLSNLASSVASLSQDNADRATVTERVTEATSIITLSLSQQQVEGEQATTISTDQIKIAVAKQYSSSWSTLSDMSVGAARASPPVSGLGLPTASSEDTAADPSITVRMNVIKSNPFYSYGEEINAGIVGEVLDLKFALNNQEEALAVAHLSEPILIKIPAQNNMDRIEHDLTKAGDRPSCKFWDESTSKWSSYGCKLHTYDAVSTSCLCNHTTSFSAALEYALPDLNIIDKEDIENLAKLNQDSMTTVIAVGIILGLYIIAMVVLQLLEFCIIGARRALHKQRAAPKDKLRGYIRPLIDRILRSHIWLSVIWIPQSERQFTRSMRITVLMIIILGSMGSNALTFGRQQANALQTILAAFVSDLLVTPFVLVFTFLFLKLSSDNSMILNRIRGKATPQEDSQLTNLDALPESQEKESKPRQQTTTNPDIEKESVSPASSTDECPSARDLPLSDDSSPVPSQRYSRKDMLYDKIDVVLAKVYLPYKTFTEHSVLYGVTVFIVATLLYFAIISLGSFAIATAAQWMGTLGIMVFCCVSTIAYFAFLEMVYLNTKVRRFRTTSMAWKGRVTSRVGIAFGIGLLSILSACIIACVFFMKQVNPAGFDWEYLFVIQLAIFGMMVMITIWMGFLFVSPTKKPKQGELRKPSLWKRPWFPNVCKYLIYVLAWGWMAGMSFILIVYGVSFDITYGPGTSLKWLAASSGSQAQNILLNKPLLFLVRFVVLAAVIKMFEFLFFRSQYTEIGGEQTGDEEGVNSERSDANNGAPDSEAPPRRGGSSKKTSNRAAEESSNTTTSSLTDDDEAGDTTSPHLLRNDSSVVADLEQYSPRKKTFAELPGEIVQDS